MGVKAARRVTNGQDKSVLKVYNRHGGGYSSSIVCVYWLAGRCKRNPCRFMHKELPTLTYNRNVKQSLNRSSDSSRKIRVIRPVSKSKYEEGSGVGKKNNKEEVSPKNQKKVCDYISTSKNNQKKVCDDISTSKNDQEGKVSAKNHHERVCEDWLSSNCLNGERCLYLHSWSCGDGFMRLTQLEGHKKAVTGVALPSGSDKLYSGSSDGTVRVWDCNTGECASVINLGDEVGSLISEGPWVFAGMPNVVKAWNIHTCADHSLGGPVGQVYAMVVGIDTLFAGVQDGAIMAWKSGTYANPFQSAASLNGHKSSVVSLAVGGNMLYSGSMDLSIKVWDIEASQCVHTLNGHSQAVMSLLFWDRFLFSCSLDGTIKVWVANEAGNLEVTYTHNEEHGVLALCGMHNTEAKPILFCSCNDNSVRLYELPSFSDRGRLFSKKEVRAIRTGPDGLFFTGDGTGGVAVWKWLAEQKSAVVSS